MQNEDAAEEKGMPALSPDAISLYLYMSHKPYVPKSVVDVQWSTPTREAFHELIAAGLVREIVIYEVVPMGHGPLQPQQRSTQDVLSPAARPVTDPTAANPTPDHHHHTRRKWHHQP